MGIIDKAAGFPDVFGLPEYFVTDLSLEIDGANVRMACGVRRGGHIHWLYTAVMPANTIFPAARDATEAACESYNLVKLMESGRRH